MHVSCQKGVACAYLVHYLNFITMLLVKLSPSVHDGPFPAQCHAQRIKFKSVSQVFQPFLGQIIPFPAPVQQILEFMAGELDDIRFLEQRLYQPPGKMRRADIH